MAKQTVKYDKNTTVTVKVDSSTTLNEGDLASINSSSQAVIAQKTTGAVQAAVGIAVRAGDGTKGDYVALAPVAEVDGFTSLTPGATYYLNTAGGVTATRPTTAGDAIQAVGVAVSATKILFNVQAQFILAQAAATTTLG
jgi:hypothetical protein